MKHKFLVVISILFTTYRLCFAGIGSYYGDEVAKMDKDHFEHETVQFWNHDVVIANLPGGVTFAEMFNFDGQGIECVTVYPAGVNAVPPEDIEEIQKTYSDHGLVWKMFKADEDMIAWITSDDNIMMVVRLKPPITLQIITHEAVEIHKQQKKATII